jgi:hypothetical protein
MIRISGMFTMIYTRRRVVVMFSHRMMIIVMITVFGDNTSGEGEQGDAGQYATD